MGETRVIELGNMTLKDGQSWITLKSGNDTVVIHLDVQAKSVQLKGQNLVVKTK